MRINRHSHARSTRPLITLVAALALAGSGVVVVNTVAGANEDPAAAQTGPQQPGADTRTIDCPDIGLAMGKVPEGARTDVAKGLTAMDAQVAGAYEMLGTGQLQDQAILKDLAEQRGRSIGAISDAVEKGGAAPPEGLESMNSCRMQPIGDAGGGAEDRGDGEQQGGDQGQQRGGPVAEDFVDITKVRPNVSDPGQQEGGSTGSFTVDCGRNEEGHFNSDNVIAAPGIGNGAHHVHDYVGNLATDAFTSDQDLAQADTTCERDDRSTHYWPVLRAVDGVTEGQPNHGGPGGGADGNVGTVLKPAGVTLSFSGSQAGDVTAMPQFLRIITGDAKAFTNGTANANASWTCEGFEDKVRLEDKYPLCPEGSNVIRSLEFQSCWDGANTDSGNHRDHVAFAREDGSCPEGFTAIPQLTQQISYDVPRGGNVPEETPFAVDSFPEQLHKPVTDHGDFINVMPEELMAEAVECINSGRDCG
ncbi:DUF1996 domain-containing protein [Streptomyces boninensis]|uniref:DUF1996 domain-containing protein n=1 Tax=Streptomyces boninensis TaxID=2039455 RepID=UPI003B2183DF